MSMFIEVAKVYYVGSFGRGLGWGLLGGPWDLVTIYNWDNNPTYN